MLWRARSSVVACVVPPVVTGLSNLLHTSAQPSRGFIPGNKDIKLKLKLHLYHRVLGWARLGQTRKIFIYQRAQSVVTSPYLILPTLTVLCRDIKRWAKLKLNSCQWGPTRRCKLICISLLVLSSTLNTVGAETTNTSHLKTLHTAHKHIGDRYLGTYIFY